MGKIVLIWAAMFVSLGLASPAHSADSKQVAREAFRDGTRLYDLSRYKEALSEFEKAYLNFEDSAFLFNIAQCHRQLNNKPEALHFYRTYLFKSSSRMRQMPPK